MFKCFYLMFAAASVALSTIPAHAQQQEATLQKVNVPGAGFDIVFVTAKPGGAKADWRGMPDPFVVYSGNGKLAFALDDKALEMLKDISVLNTLACTFQAASNDDKSSTPVSVYVVPKHEVPATIGMASRNAPQPQPIMHKVKVLGGAFDIVFAVTEAPVALNRNEQIDSLSVYSIGSEFAMAVEGDVKKMFKDVGYAELPPCAFEVEHKGSNPPQAASVYIFPKN